MLKTRFSRFLSLAFIIGALLGVVYALKWTGIFDLILPNLKDIEGFYPWTPLLPPAAVCIIGQLLGDILNVKMMDNGFCVFLKRILFLAVTVLVIVWNIYSYDTDYSVQYLAIENGFMSIGALGALFAYIAYVFAYVFWTPKKLYPFFFVISAISALVVDALLCLFWPDGGFWLFLALIVVVVAVFFLKPDERLFEEYDTGTAHDAKKIAEELAYLNDPHLRPGLARDYDENGYYFGARCSNCAHYKYIYDENRFGRQYYCALTNQSCQDHESCDRYQRAK